MKRVLFVIVFILLGCATKKAPSQRALMRYFESRVWDVQAAKWIQAEELMEELRRADFLFLGEKHDNQTHHDLQAYIIRKLRTRRSQMTVAFEQIDQGESKSTWANWFQYKPVYKAARQSGYKIIGLSPSKRTIRSLSVHGLKVFDQTMVAKLGLNKRPPKDVQEEMREEMRKAHCYKVPEERLDTMVLAQRARDASMAWELYTQEKQNPAILIVGEKHARRNRGMPLHLKTLEPNSHIKSLRFQEIREDKLSPFDYIAPYDDGSFDFDYLWFTIAVDFEDPCVKYQKQLKAFKKKE